MKKLKFIKYINLKKSFNKVSYKGKKNYEINNFLYKKILFPVTYDNKKVHRLIKRKLFRFNFLRNYRYYKIWILKSISYVDVMDKYMLKNFLEKIFLLKYLFFCYAWTGIFALQYGKMLDNHLEIIRRRIRQNVHNDSLIDLCIRPYKILLKRPNQIRMGRGKGSKVWKIIYPIYPGLEIVRVKGNSFVYINSLIKYIKIKIPFKITCVCLSLF